MERRHLAIRTGMTRALAAYRPKPYAGAVTIFASKDRIGRVQELKPGWYALARTWRLYPIAAPHADIFGPALPELGDAFGKAVADAVAAGQPSY